MKTQLTISIHLPASVPTLFLPVLWMESPCCYLRPSHCSCTETHPLLCIHRNCSRNRSLFCSSSLCYAVITPVLIKPSFDSTPFTTTLFLHFSAPSSRKFLGGFVFLLIYLQFISSKSFLNSPQSGFHSAHSSQQPLSKLQ